MKLLDCLKDISRKPKYHERIHNLIMEIVKKKVSSNTVWDWLKGNFVPKGTNLIRLMVILELLGYEISEWSDLSSPIKMIAECFVFGVISEEEMEKEIFEGFSQVHMMRILLGRGGTIPRKIKEIEDRIKSKEEILLEKKIYWEDRFFSLKDDLPKKEKLEKPFDNIDGQENVFIPQGFEKDQLINSLAHIVLAGIPFAKILLSERFTSEDRRKFRELAKGDGVFTLKNLLSCLCSETARNS